MQPLCNLAQEFAGNIGSATVMTLLSIPANALPRHHRLDGSVYNPKLLLRCQALYLQAS